MFKGTINCFRYLIPFINRAQRVLFLKAIRRISRLGINTSTRYSLFPISETWLITDKWQGECWPAELNLHFAPEVKVEKISDPLPGIKLSREDGNSLWIFSLNGFDPIIGHGWVSRSYGVREYALTAKFEWSKILRHRLAIIPCKPFQFIDIRLDNFFFTIVD